MLNIWWASITTEAGKNPVLLHSGSLPSFPRRMHTAKSFIIGRIPVRDLSKIPSVYWCLNRHLCDLREGFGKKHLNLVIVFRKVFCEVFRKMFHEMCSVKCSMKCVLRSVPWNLFHKVFHKMCSAKCSMKCVPQSVLRNVFCEVCSTKCSMKFVPRSVLWNVSQNVPQNVLWKFFCYEFFGLFF